MLQLHNEYTKRYTHYYHFEFRGNQYNTHSIVKLSKYGKDFFGSKTDNVILMEQYIWWNGRMCWKYKFRRWPQGIVEATTDEPPDKLIDNVVVSVTKEYSSIETHGALSPYFATEVRSKRDKMPPEKLLKGLVFTILASFIAAIFRDPEIKSTWIGVVVTYFIAYCVVNKPKRFIYIKDENDNALREKHKTLYEVPYQGDYKKYE